MGVEATGKICLLGGGREVKIVARSASALAQERQAVLAAGLDDFLRKPYRREEIFDCMARNLGVRDLYRDGQSLRQADSIPAIPRDLAMLPEDLRKGLLDAVVHLDSGRIQGVIGRVREQDPQAGEFLARPAKQPAYSSSRRLATASKLDVRAYKAWVSTHMFFVPYLSEGRELAPARCCIGRRGSDRP